MKNDFPYEVITESVSLTLWLGWYC